MSGLKLAPVESTLCGKSLPRSGDLRNVSESIRLDHHLVKIVGYDPPGTITRVMSSRLKATV
jgi:hypothetical protein